MGKRLNRTLLNWRWWAILPVWVALLPVVALELVLLVLITTGEVADDIERKIIRTSQPLMRWLKAWNKGATP